MRFNHHEYNNDDDDQDDVEGFLTGDEGYPDYDDDDSAEEAFYENYSLRLAEITLIGAELNRKVMADVVKMLENSFLWKFRSHATRLKMIEESYKVFLKQISEEDEKKEESEE